MSRFYTIREQSQISDYEEQLVKNSKILHPNHHINIDLKYTLVQLYGRLNGNNSPGDLYKVNLRKKELCLNVLEVMDLVSRIVAAFLYALKYINNSLFYD